MVKKIIIVGGGSAGWMSAATLKQCFPNKEITLIESPKIETIGVGESTIQQIKEWVHLLDINDKSFIPETDAILKLSIKFQDFYKKGEHFHYPFGEANYAGNNNENNDWWFKKIYKSSTPNNNYAESNYPIMSLIKNNKISTDLNKRISFFSFYKDCAYHFDATKFAIWLRDNYCKPLGVKHIKEEIKEIQQDDNGIKSLNGKYKADLYIDCTGFKSLLLGKTLNEKFESYEDLLPNNSAWATKLPYKDKKKQMECFTTCTAYNNGWIWNIPLWSRIGTGYVYSDKFISDEDALKEFQKYLGTKDLEFKKIKMKVGIHKRLWVKNVAAVGLAAGFIEPLESNGLFTVHQFLLSLVENLSRKDCSQWDKDNYTYECKRLFNNFAEFVALHYALSHRKDTTYWKNNFNKQWEEKLINLDPTFASGFLKAVGNRVYDNKHDVFGGFHCIAAGMNWAPTSLYKLITNNLLNSKAHWTNFLKERTTHLDEKVKNWDELCKEAPSTYSFMKKNFYS